MSRSLSLRFFTRMVDSFGVLMIAPIEEDVLELVGHVALFEVSNGGEAVL